MTGVILGRRRRRVLPACLQSTRRLCDRSVRTTLPPCQQTQSLTCPRPPTQQQGSTFSCGSATRVDLQLQVSDMGRPSAAGQPARDIQSLHIVLLARTQCCRPSDLASLSPSFSCPCDLNAVLSFIVYCILWFYLAIQPTKAASACLIVCVSCL